MVRRSLIRELKLEAVRLVRGRGVSVAQFSRNRCGQGRSAALDQGACTGNHGYPAGVDYGVSGTPNGRSNRPSFAPPEQPETH